MPLVKLSLLYLCQTLFFYHDSRAMHFIVNKVNIAMQNRSTSETNLIESLKSSVSVAKGNLRELNEDYIHVSDVRMLIYTLLIHFNIKVSFYLQDFSRNARLKLAKSQAKVKQHPETEL